MPGELIITNGDSAANLLQEASIGDERVPWRDSLHEGPVPQTEDLATLSIRRAKYLARGVAADIKAIEKDFNERDALLTNNQDFSDVTLWFEHDLYDQLQLLQILAWFADHWRDDGRVFLVQTDDYLGMQTPQTIGRFATQRAPVSGLQLSMAKVAWAAFRHDTPEPWAKLLGEDLAALPFLKAAVLRQLEELPDAGNSLSRVQNQILKVIADGSTTPGFSFATYLASEEAKFLGDTSFFKLLDGLAFCAKPLIAKAENRNFMTTDWRDSAQRKLYFQDQLTLTPLGHDVLAGRTDFAALNVIDHWWGGTHLTTTNLWRWDRDAKRLIAPSADPPS